MGNSCCLHGGTKREDVSAKYLPDPRPSIAIGSVLENSQVSTDTIDATSPINRARPLPTVPAKNRGEF